MTQIQQVAVHKWCTSLTGPHGVVLTFMDYRDPPVVHFDFAPLRCTSVHVINASVTVHKMWPAPGSF